ncbi:MAG: glycosyltransferase family 2 protein [Deltaproteobacteria bacterium]|nr:glycosyltransferase family 2 protein [Deltaproteobacteria bacterium]
MTIFETTSPIASKDPGPSNEGPRADISLESLGYQVFSTLKAPVGWAERVRHQAEVPADERDAHWLKHTGVQTRDSYFTLVVPIHNEAAGLNTFLGVLMHSFVPRAVNVQIVFVTNGCTDGSAQGIREALETIARYHDDSAPGSNPQVKNLETSLRDDGIREPPIAVAVNSSQYVHIDTDTRGKANALNLGNELALQAGHRVVISIDSDCCPEPAALMTMFAEMHAEIQRNSERPGVVSGMQSLEWNPERELFPAERTPGRMFKTHRDANKDARGVLGWLMGWDAQWLQRSGGVPQSVIEDFALGLQADILGGGKRVVDAKIWGYGPTERADYWGAYRRWSQGAFQLRDRYAHDQENRAYVWRETAKEASPYSILYHVAREVYHSRMGLLTAAYRTVRHAYSFVMGWLDNRRDPKSQTWEQLRSTRLR